MSSSTWREADRAPSIRGSGRLGHARRASVAGPYHAFAADAIRGTRLVATLPWRFAGDPAADPSLAVAEAPEEIGTMSFVMAWV